MVCSLDEDLKVFFVSMEGGRQTEGAQRTRRDAEETNVRAERLEKHARGERE